MVAVTYCGATSLLTVIFQQTVVPTQHNLLHRECTLQFPPKVFAPFCQILFLFTYTLQWKGAVAESILHVLILRAYLSANGRSTGKACQVSLWVTPRYQIKWDCWWVTCKILIWSLTPCVALGQVSTPFCCCLPTAKVFACYTRFLGRIHYSAHS